MIKYLFAWLLLAGSAWAAQAQPGGPAPVDLDGVATIIFPVAPNVLDTLGQRIYSAQDAGLTYMVMSRHVDAQPGFRLADGDLDGFYQGLAKGVVAASQGKVVAQQSFDVQGLRGIELVYTNTRNPVFPPKITSRTIYLNGYLFIYQVLPTGEAQPDFTARQGAFFTSFALQPSVAQNGRQFTLDAAGQPDQSTAARLGQLSGRIAFYALLAGLVYFLLRRFRLIGRKGR
ncbi:hypothetical protein GCM10027048_22080 [Hymenobacter coalescens]